MTIHVVRLGNARLEGEGLRIGTVRRPPRGVPKAEFASRNFYDVWLPDLAPSEELLKLGQASAGDERHWGTFVKRYRAEMNQPEKIRLLDLLAALSRQTGRLGRVLLRRREPVSPVGAARAARRARRTARIGQLSEPKRCCSPGTTPQPATITRRSSAAAAAALPGWCTPKPAAQT